MWLSSNHVHHVSVIYCIVAIGNMVQYKQQTKYFIKMHFSGTFAEIKSPQKIKLSRYIIPRTATIYYDKTPKPSLTDMLLKCCTLLMHNCYRISVCAPSSECIRGLHHTRRALRIYVCIKGITRASAWEQWECTLRYVAYHLFTDTMMV